jgi:ParB-like chromosome segregation protein Spo0J
VVAGNTRLKAAQSLGMTEVPVWWFDGSDLDATAFAIADNRSHEFADWNDAELIRLLEHLKAGFLVDDGPDSDRPPHPGSTPPVGTGSP